MKTKQSKGGFSLVEVISVIAVLGIAASMAMAVVGDVSQNARKQKLNSDTKTLNRAVLAYRASGGDLDSADTAAKVLAKLRTRASSASANRIPGMAGGFLDRRMAIRTQTVIEAASNGARVYWDSTSQTFFVAYSGSQSGIKEFYLDDNLAEIDGGEEDRQSPLLYAGTETGNWIWEYADVALPSGPTGPAPVALTPDTLSTNPAIPVAPLPPIPVVPGSPLQPPVFSLPGGDYSITNYELSISLNNPNSPGISDIFYSVNYGSWQAYSGSFITSPDDIISAQAIARTTDYSDSVKSDQTYKATPATLSPPVINASRDNFGLFFNRSLWIDLMNTNQLGVSEIRYRLNGGSWMAYSSKFKLTRSDYPTGVTIEAQSISAGSPYFNSSTVSSRLMGSESLDLNGTTVGSFSDPVGPSGMITNLSPGESSDHFEWGDDSNNASLSKSTMDFAGSTFGNIAGGERFQIGNLDYYNGAIRGGSGADSVGFQIGLGLNINGNIFNPYFDFEFELINTANLNDPDNLWPDADYVVLTDPRASRTLVINDYEFEFRVELGDSSADGFALFDEFYVLEERTASVNVYGTFVEIGPVASSPSSPAPAPIYQNTGFVDVEQAVNDLLDQVKFEKTTAKKAKNTADDAKKSAKEAAENAHDAKDDALDEDDADDARKYADRARQYADKAVTYASEAKLGANNAAAAAAAAQASANQASLLAQSDSGAEADAKKAQDEAKKATDEAERAAAKAAEAGEAATEATGDAAKANAHAISLGG